LKKTELQLLWPFYVTAFSSSASSVALPVWMIFFQTHFSFLQISFALSLQSLASIMFEIPTGAIADLFGRKVSVVSGIVLQGLLWLALPFIHSETVLYFAFFLMGFLRTLESGADHAWMVDWLKGNKQAKLIQEMFIKINSLHSVGRVLSSLLATLLLLFMEIRFLFFVQGCGYILESALLFFFAREKVRQRRRTAKNLLHHALHLHHRAPAVAHLATHPWPHLLTGTHPRQSQHRHQCEQCHRCDYDDPPNIHCSSLLPTFRLTMGFFRMLRSKFCHSIECRRSHPH